MIMLNLCLELLMKYIIFMYFVIEFIVFNYKYIVVYFMNVNVFLL